MTTDWADFTNWQRVRVQRQKGRPPAATTLVRKVSALRTAAAALSATGLGFSQPVTPESVGRALGDRASVEALLDVLGVRLSQGSLCTTYDALTDFAGYAVAKGWASQSALLPSDRPAPGPQKPITVYTPAELGVILSGARGRGLRFWMLLETLAGTGRRIGEMLNLEWRQVMLGADVPHLDLTTTKNGRQNFVPLNKRLREDVWTPENVQALRTGTGPAKARTFRRSIETFPFPWNYQVVCEMFSSHCERMGVQYRGFHCFRHTRATDLLAKGVPIQAVSAVLGHSSVQTTDRYYNHATALSYAHLLD